MKEELSHSTKNIPIAVVGMSGYFPESPSLADFWRHICSGDDLLRDVPESHWLKEDYSDAARGLDIPSPRGGFLPWLDFDPIEFGIPPAQLKNIDTVQLLTLLAMRDLLGQLDSVSSGSVEADKISVILGVAAGTEMIGQMSGKIQRGVWTAALRNEGVPEEITQRVCDRIEESYADWNESTFPGLLANVVAGRITNRFDFGGTNCTVDAACASSLAAMTMGIYELQLGVSDLVVGGGADALNDPFMHMCFSRTFALSKKGDCRPFDAEADGTLLGEGIGLLALRRLEDAEADGDKIHAVIRGYGSSSDGRHKSIYAPRPAGQEKALKRAYERAGIDPKTVNLVEAHGTGTIAGDAAECASLKAVYGDDEKPAAPWCGLGSVKSQIGHTKSAAGAAALIKTVMGLRHGVLPPSIKVDNPNPSLELESSPFYINTDARPWIPQGGTARRAAVSSFGFGGSNYHFVLEEYTGTAPKPRRVPRVDSALILVSSPDTKGLQSRIKELGHEFNTHSLVDVAANSQTTFDPSQHLRCGVVVQSPDEAIQKLTTACERLSSSKTETGSEPGLFWAKGEIPGKIAFLFPGQGSQYPGMAGALVQEFDAAQQIWSTQGASSSLGNLVYPKPDFAPDSSRRQEESLRQTENAQPALGLTSAALLAVLKQLGLEPDIVAGHSYGEITALFAAGVLPDLAALLKVSQKRGELLAAKGEIDASMLAVQDCVDNVKKWIEESGEPVTIANDNAPSQVVVAAETSVLDRFVNFLGEQKVACQKLNVSNAFHSEFVAGKAPQFVEALESVDWRSPSIPIFSNQSATAYEPERTHLGEQIKSPVRFREMIANLYDDGVRTFVEVGPHNVLTGLVSQCLKGADVHSVALDSRHDKTLKSFWEGIGRIAVLGKPLDFASLWKDFDVQDLSEPLPELSPATVKINGANYGKPYPPEGGFAAIPLPVQTTEMPGTPPPSSPQPAPEPEPLPVPATPPPSADALLSIQHSALEAQRTFQETLERSHQEFLRMTEGMIHSLSGQTGSTLPPLPATRPALETAWTAPSLPETTPAPAPISQPIAEEIPVTTSAVQEELAAPKTESIPGTPTSPGSSSQDFASSLLEVVSETTGYPIEMLDLDQELESGLGIDSIKRVEILSALQQRHPEIAGQDTNELASLRTLREIVELSTGAEAIAETVPTDTGGIAFETSLLEVVSESTGYPIEMLDLDQELESGLGIDSIKRVEILSALQQRHPEIAGQDTNELASLRTLREIVELSTGGSSNPEPSSEAADDDEFETTLLEVVSESTGYPIEMLDLNQELESGLGIDSIKRVEILSALQQRFPALANEDTNQVAALRTLGEIVALVKGDKPDEAPGEEPASHEEDLHRYVLDAIPKRAPGLAISGLQDGKTVFLIRDSRGIAEHLSELLTSAGIPSSTVDSPPADATHLILLQGLDCEDEAGESTLLQCFDHLKSCASSMAEAGRLFVTVQDLGGSFGVEQAPSAAQASLGGISAFARTLRREWPGAAVKAIDVQSDGRSAEEVADAIYRELMLGADDLEVGLSRNGSRTVPQLREEPLEIVTESRFKDGDVLVVTGGARGVTASCIESLASAANLKIAILARTELEEEPEHTKDCKDEAEIKAAIIESVKSSGESPSLQEVKQTALRILANREVEASLEAIREKGSETIYLESDVTNAEDVESALNQVREEYGPIRAIIHAAGVLRDTHLVSMTREQFEVVFRTKVIGFQNLLRFTSEDPLHTLCCFSSIAARVGNEGQLNYNVANEVLNKMCLAEKSHRSEEFLAKSIAWGPWDGGMVNSHLRKHFEELGVSLISLEAGSEAFLQEMQSDPSGKVEVLLTGTVSQKFLVDAREELESAYLLREDICPYLNDHEILANAVMPVTMAIELALRSSNRVVTEPNGFAVILSGIHVLKGVQAPRFKNVGDWLTLRAGPNGSDASRTIEILGDDDRLSYQITREEELNGAVSPPEQPAEMDAWDWDLDTIYRTRALLFHGPEFHVLKSLGTIGEWGCTGIVERPQVPSGPDLDWSSDLFVLDGGLQLGVLWVWKYHEKHVLPTKVDHIRFFRSGLLDGPIHCVMKTRSHNLLQSSFDIWWLDEAGNVLVHAEGVQMTHIPTSWIPEEIAGKSTSYFTESTEAADSVALP